MSINEKTMKNIIVLFVIALFAALSSSVVYSDTYTLNVSWIDATQTGAGYDPVYGVQVEQDGAALVEDLTLQAPLYTHVWTAPPGIVVTVRMRNSNEVVTPQIDGAWSANVVAQMAESPAPVSISTVVLQHSP